MLFVIQIYGLGVVSFGLHPFIFFPFIPWPAQYSPPPVIAPLWINQSYDSLYYRVTENTEDLADVSAVIMELNMEFADFQPRMAVIATWFSSIDVSSFPD